MQDLLSWLASSSIEQGCISLSINDLSGPCFSLRNLFIFPWLPGSMFIVAMQMKVGGQVE
jgi:hypothetical protein